MIDKQLIDNAVKEAIAKVFTILHLSIHEDDYVKLFSLCEEMLSIHDTHNGFHC